MGLLISPSLQATINYCANSAARNFVRVKIGSLNQAQLYTAMPAQVEIITNEFKSAWVFDSEQQHTMNSLDERIEKWLAKHGAVVDFEVDDALNKLLELGLLNREGNESNSENPLSPEEQITILEPVATLARLDEIWDGIYNY